MKCFQYKERLYARILPAKRLFNSTMVYEVVNRGDIFALDLVTMQFTVIPGQFMAEFFEVELILPAIQKEQLALDLDSL